MGLVEMANLVKAQSAEPPWYGPVCPVVWEGRHREVSPYPDQLPRAFSDLWSRDAEKRLRRRAQERRSTDVVTQTTPLLARPQATSSTCGHSVARIQAPPD